MEAKRFETKDSGKRATFQSGMQRDTNEGKPRYDLVIPMGCQEHMLKRWAELMERGARKYSPRNWEQANSQGELERFKESAFRHFIQWYDGDEGEDHAAATYFNIQAAEHLAEKLRRKK